MGGLVTQEVMHRIAVDPLVKGGKPVIKGTRIPVELIPGKLAAGLSNEEIIEEYELSREDIYAALSYAVTLLSDEQVRMVQ